MDSSALHEIANQASLIRGGYKKAADRRRWQADACLDARQHGTAQEVSDSRISYTAADGVCIEYFRALAKLAGEVATHLPGLFPELRLVGLTERWDGIANFDWDAAERELRSIEAAALSGAAQLEDAEGLALESLKAADESVLIGFGKVWPEKFRTRKRAKAFLGAHPEIHTRKPSPQRLEIHAGEWAKYWTSCDGKAFDAIGRGESPEPITPELTTDFITGAQERYKAMLAKKSAENRGK